MLGAVIGDIIGSYYECHCTKNYDFELFTRESSFTDDTVLLAATCDAILFDPSADTHSFKLRNRRILEYAARYRQFYSRYPHAGYGKMFMEWAQSRRFYKLRSFANGAAMRVLPVGYAYKTMEEVLMQAKLSAVCTHNDKDAVRGAQAVAAAVFMAHNGYSRKEIKDYLMSKHLCRLGFSTEDIKDGYVFDSAACYSVPPSIVCFLESESYEDAVRKAVSLGGDADTMACIAGGIAEAFGFKIPPEIRSKGLNFLDGQLKNVFRSFNEKYISNIC
ncbi:MAG: ADP-ribosylglycohydrolase family protein [Oscillospiraceae bacterium]|nr:ADP-ribosylglycohydrolase family protein [Oscillospiraceae bacterium]